MEDHNKSIRESIYIYQAILKANVFPEIFINAIGSDINYDTVEGHLREKLETVIKDLNILNENITKRSADG